MASTDSDDIDNYVNETFSERFWCAMDALPQAERVYLAGRTIKKVGWWLGSSIAVMFLPLAVDAVFQKVFGD